MFVVDLGASMHMLSRKDLSSDELDTFQKIQKPHRSDNGKRGSANKRGGASVRPGP